MTSKILAVLLLLVSIGFVYQNHTGKEALAIQAEKLTDLETRYEYSISELERERSASLVSKVSLVECKGTLNTIDNDLRKTQDELNQTLASLNEMAVALEDTTAALNEKQEKLLIARDALLNAGAALESSAAYIKKLEADKPLTSKMKSVFKPDAVASTK